MKIILRTLTGWSQPVPNMSLTHCDIDGQRLWIAPHGRLYCDQVHT